MSEVQIILEPFFGKFLPRIYVGGNLAEVREEMSLREALTFCEFVFEYHRVPREEEKAIYEISSVTAKKGEVVERKLIELQVALDGVARTGRTKWIRRGFLACPLIEFITHGSYEKNAR